MMKIFLLLGLILVNQLVRAQNIAAGDFNSFMICATGTVKAWGDNHSGALGLGDYINRKLPEEIPGMNNVVKVSSSRNHALFLKSDGTVWAAGGNNLGQLGDGTLVNKKTPVQITSLTGIIDISAGWEYSLFLKNDGTVWSCGLNDKGQLGLGNNNNTNIPMQVAGLSGITKIFAAYQHSLFLKNDGTVWGTGNKVAGFTAQVNPPASINIPDQIINIDNITAIAAGDNHSLFLKNDGTVWVCGFSLYVATGLTSHTLAISAFDNVVQIPGLSGISDIYSMHNSSLFLKNDGTVLACGRNSNYEFGLSWTNSIIGAPALIPNLSGITQISCGESHTLFLKNDGTVWVCGANGSYQQANGGINGNNASVQNIGNPCAIPPTPPQVDFSNFPSSLCLGSNVISEPSISGSNPMIGGGVDSSIIVNAPKAICRNNDAVFVLEANDQIKSFDFNGNLLLTYNAGGTFLNSITAMAADDNDNVWVSSSAYPDRIYRFGTANDTSSIQSYYITSLSSMGFFDYNYTPGNLFTTSTDGNLVSIDQNDTDPFTNSNLQAGISLNANPVTSMTCDNLEYAEKRIIYADPVGGKIWARQLFDANASNLDASLLIDSTLTQGQAFDYVWADTTRPYYNILASSSTTGAIGLITNSKNPDGSYFGQIDTLITGLVNSQMPVGIVSIPFGNLPEYWIADKLKNKVLRVRLYVYELIPELPEGLKFNTFTGKIEGTPVNISGIQTYQVIIHNNLGTDTSTFTFAVNPPSNIANTVGSSSASGQVDDGLSIKYFENNSCSRLLEIADSIGGTSPGHTSVTQTVYPFVSVIANDSLIRRVNALRADNQDSLQVDIKLFYSYQDIQLFNQTRGSVLLSNDTTGGTMQMAVLQMHDKPDGSKEPIIHSPVTATWSTANQHWAATVPVTKFSDFYGSDIATLSTFDCSNTGSSSLNIPNSYYVWNYDTLFTSGTYVDTLINKTGCDSITTLNLALNPTGLSEAASSSSIHLFPNPNNGILNITFAGNAVAPDRVRIMNIIGNEVYNQAVTGNTQIDITSFNSGIYFVSVDTKDQTFVYRIIKE
ncbi:MAG: T9SS type A sorting domain-containing protein [Bacteroidota bacterium]|nr:T9SS type A sorting domain-containing protein [Bacteroidota bacterium]